VKLNTRTENQKDCLPFGMNLEEREWKDITGMGKKRDFKLLGMSQEKWNKKSIFKKERKRIVRSNYRNTNDHVDVPLILSQKKGSFSPDAMEIIW
jgi:hypothetical protein